MRDLIRYLADFECTAGNLYADAAAYFDSDPALSSFLKDLEQDEISHYDMMNRIDDMISDRLEGFHLDILISRKTQEQLEAHVLKFRERLSHGTLNEAALFNILVDIEYSEWNDMFIYIIDTMKDLSLEFQHTAALLEAHKRKIEKCLEERPGMGQILNRLKEIRHVWDERVLIIDDDPALLKLFYSFLRKRYGVDSAMDGNEALRKLTSQYYDVIVSDITLPELSGIEVYREALKRDQTITRRFIFFTGDLSPEYKKFFEQEGLEYLYKPVSLEVIEEKIQEILGRGDAAPAA
ncbi:MAG: response regulator [Desulfomonilia bacterium]|jgi:CheY-like chemotaxis protein